MTSLSRRSVQYSVQLLAATFAFCIAGVQAQGQAQTKPGVAPQVQRPAAISAAPAPASVEIVALSATPAQPKQGDVVTIKLSIRNSGQSAVAQVPWSIHWNTANQTLAQGVQPNVALGAVFEVTASWRAVPGEQLIQGYVDASGKTFNNAAPVAKRIANLPLTIAQISASTQGTTPAPGSAPKLETQVLNFQKAKEAGAVSVSALMPGAPVACSTFGIHEEQSVSASNSGRGSVYLDWSCVGAGTATGEAFKNFKLKNGWKIKAISQVAYRETTWQYRLRPQEGTNDPHLIAEITTSSGSFLILIDIEGPAGTSPYLGQVVNP